MSTPYVSFDHMAACSSLHISDPQGTRTDAEIISALQRAWLLPRDGSPVDPMVEAKFSLNAAVSDEGQSLPAAVERSVTHCTVQDPIIVQERSSCLRCAELS